ncbi:putative phospholipase B1 membrane-associated-like [Scophthalmus maximus]|uniref:Putative phospholipase B1 membrane-associated-like n=1 Tax=Scophthalmus maximus TaxID=52904 RepID=A0A2U9CWH9_SCOMX|nr:putative phospholipase B1 membrane-associated-like [Scophthalmus maximus]
MWPCFPPLDFTCTELMTLFNPALISPVSDETSFYAPQFAQQRTLVEQAQDVSLYLQDNKVADADSDWKLVLLFVRVDRLCAFKQQQSAIQAVVEDVDDALQSLRSQLSRTIVSVALWDGEHDAFQYKYVHIPKSISDTGFKY